MKDIYLEYTIGIIICLVMSNIKIIDISFKEESIGSYFSKHIAKNYKYEKVSD